MVTSNKDLMTQAREALAGRWGLAVGTFFVYMLIIGGLNNGYWSFTYGLYSFQLGFSLIFLLIGGALVFGIYTFTLAIARKEEANFKMIFSGFAYYSKTLGLFLLIALFVMLWMMLLIIPGIIAAISYSMSFYIMCDDPTIDAMDAINKSKKMMYGYKWKYFCLGLRFLGWFLLGFLSMGIGFLWIIPYINVSVARFYEDVKANYVENR
jgi:uncharacterized membrane protein